MRSSRALAPRNLSSLTGLLPSRFKLVVLARPVPVSAQHWQSPQCRRYAVNSPSRTSRPPVSQSPTVSTETLFHEADIPSISFWRSVEQYGPPDLSAEDYHRTAAKYCEVVPKRATNWMWKAKLERDHGIDTYTMYWAAIVMLTSSSSDYLKLVYSLLTTASDLGYSPASISTVRLFLLGLKDGVLNPRFKSKTARFMERLNALAKSGDPDALTVQGLICLQLKDVDGALKRFNLAIKSGESCSDVYVPAMTRQEIQIVQDVKAQGPGGQRRPKWAAESECYCGRGAAFLLRGDKKAAEASFRIAALELGSPQAYLELGKLVPPDSPERDGFLQMAAVSGEVEACAQLAASYRDKLANDKWDRKEREDLERWAAEWLKLA